MPICIILYLAYGQELSVSWSKLRDEYSFSNSSSNDATDCNRVSKVNETHPIGLLLKGRPEDSSAGELFIKANATWDCSIGKKERRDET